MPSNPRERRTMPTEDTSIHSMMGGSCHWCSSRMETILVEHLWVCPNHLSRYYAQCQRCATWVDRYSLHQLATNGSTHGDAVCTSCYNAAPVCTVCSRHYSEPEQCCDPSVPRCCFCRCSIRLTGGPTNSRARLVPPDRDNPEERHSCRYCFEDRFTACSDCTDIHDRSRMHHIRNTSSWICTACSEAERYERCDYCCCLYNLEYGQCHIPHNPDDEDCECESCGEIESGGIHSYSYKPRPVFKGVGPVFLGWELEVESRGGYNQPEELKKLVSVTIRSVGDSAYLKSDSSINYGFELVTHPMSYDWAMAEFNWGAFDRMSKAGAYAGNACGLHVHVSKAGFSNPAHDYRWLMFWHRNQRTIKKIARRDSDQWAPFRTSDRKDSINIAKKKNTSHERYCAINPTNENTYEVRVYASSLDVQEVQAALALVDATVEYTRKLSSNDVLTGAGWTFGAFRQWLKGHPEYRPLINELNKITFKRGN
jgi:hypothetical protein